jgi:hypothetical protein
MVATEFNIFTISTSASALIGVPIGSVPIKVFMVSFLFILYHGDWHGIAVGVVCRHVLDISTIMCSYHTR